MKQFVWLPIHLCESKVFSFLQSNDNIAMGEYFETDVKSEDNFDIELESKELKLELISYSSDKECMTEYFDTDVMILILKSDNGH